jgi:hypothetical protein
LPARLICGARRQRFGDEAILPGLETKDGGALDWQRCSQCVSAGIGTGRRQQTLSRWLQEPNSLAVMPAKRPKHDWSIEDKIRILAKPSTLTGAEVADFLQREGVLQAEYQRWRLALGEKGRLR